MPAPSSRRRKRHDTAGTSARRRIVRPPCDAGKQHGAIPRPSSAITEGLRRAPNAVYALVQTALVQDEALQNADARIRELEGAAPPERAASSTTCATACSAGAKCARLGAVGPAGRAGRRARASRPARSRRPEQAPATGGSFLGTAAAAAAGVIGGALLMNSLRSMLGGGAAESRARSTRAGGEVRNPWAGGNSGGDLARRPGSTISAASGRQASADDGDKRQGLFDTAQNEATTTTISTTTAISTSAATPTPPDRDAHETKRPPRIRGGLFDFDVRRQITMTLVPTLTRS